MPSGATPIRGSSSPPSAAHVSGRTIQPGMRRRSSVAPKGERTIGEALSHLVYLASKGELKQFEEDGVVRFQRA